MTVFLSKRDGAILLQVRAEGPGLLGDLVRELRPGDSAFGKSYEEWDQETPGPVSWVVSRDH
jgi:hypothetical protein